ncbi:B-type cyclin [Seminavis robusta]|uniref:B-type cyclin n=1 Tax=Seminavis robusta TaxID=568900 RepID=A0A9N8EKR6_9STRA|nr:B-type cyclin [Seminavis robusta]|eukprot:Sro1125_g243970.1 B-type cyclin (369) ;mRNA; f:29012-30118
MALQKSRNPLQNVTNVSKQNYKAKKKIKPREFLPRPAIARPSTLTSNVPGVQNKLSHKLPEGSNRQDDVILLKTNIEPVQPKHEKNSAVHPFQKAIEVSSCAASDILKKYTCSNVRKNATVPAASFVLPQEIQQEDLPVTVPYADDIHTTLRSQEHLAQVSPSYLADQPFLSSDHRASLIDWITNVNSFYDFSSKTLHLAVNLFDRFLDTTTDKRVRSSKLQLGGAACFWIASKYEEICNVSMNDLVYLCQKKYPPEDFVAAEEAILKTLDYGVSFPTASTFLDLYLQVTNAEESTSLMAHNILDRTLPCHDLLIEFRPSQMASASLFLAFQKRSVPWAPAWARYTGYEAEDLEIVADAMENAFARWT